jgi:hypothetical protein
MPRSEKAGGSDITPQEYRAVKKVAHSFISAFKYYSLYPKDHVFSHNHLRILLTDLQDFLATRQNLRFDIEHYTVSCDGRTLVQGTGDDSNPFCLLSRDSILFLEFSRGIEHQEIAALFDILNRHRNPLEDVEGDIATSLWHIPFNHIHYEAADIFAMDAIDFDLSMFRPGPRKQAAVGLDPAVGVEAAQQQGETGDREKFGSHDGTDQHYAGFYGDREGTDTNHRDGPDSSGPGLLHIAGENDLAELTTDERTMLENYILQEKGRDQAGDTIDILLIILSIETDQIEFATLLDLLESEYFDALAEEKYHLAFRICKNIKNISAALGQNKQWAVSLINMFFTALARGDRYQDLPALAGGSIFAPDPEQLRHLLSVFAMLPAECVSVLASFAVKTAPDNLRVRNEILGLIERKAAREPGCLQQIIEGSDEATCLFIFPVIGILPAGDALRLYLRLTRLPFPSLRRIGLDGIFRCGESLSPADLAHLLIDEDGQIRERIISYFESLAAKEAEGAIIDFLRTEEARRIDPLHILRCYRILSGSLSDTAMNFLEQVLLESKITSVFSRYDMIHKKGAAYALLKSGRQEAGDIVRRGADSVRPDIRLACQKVLGAS